jgi:ATP-dependent RNA helicase DDX24/MAK5
MLLSRFKSVPNAVLVATDVAARGLDIQAVDHVVHYQLPRTADVYVHRNGRTARAKRDGFSLQLVGPEEQKVARAVLQSLGRSMFPSLPRIHVFMFASDCFFVADWTRYSAEMVPNLSVGYDMLAKLKDRVTLARQIDAASHAVKKANHERNWLKETAEALEVELSDEDDEEMGSVGRGKRR